MSETSSTPAGEVAAETPEVNEPLGDGGKKALEAERAAAKAATARVNELQKQLDAINQANETALEKAQREADEARTEATAAKSDALRFRVAAAHGISSEDADLFLTGSDEETLQKQAARLAERTPATSLKPDPSQGGSGAPLALNSDGLEEALRNKLGIS